MSMYGPAHQESTRAARSEVVVRLLAIIGAVTVLSAVVGFWRAHAGPAVESGTITYENGRPAVGVPIFLDRG
jgi:hypothetical protein